MRGRGTGTRRRLQKHSFCDGCGKEEEEEEGGEGEEAGTNGAISPRRETGIKRENVSVTLGSTSCVIT